MLHPALLIELIYGNRSNKPYQGNIRQTIIIAKIRIADSQPVELTGVLIDDNFNFKKSQFTSPLQKSEGFRAKASRVTL